MPMYRNRDSAIVRSEAEVKELHKNVSFSKIVDTFNDLGWDEIIAVNMPAASSDMKIVVEGTPAQVDGQWTQVWEEQDRFSTDSDGTKAEKEAAYQAQLNTEKAAAVRSERDQKLKETDFYALEDVEMPDDIRQYRQALRDVPQQDAFPHDVNWPTI